MPFVFRADTCADGAPLAAASQQWERAVARKPLGKKPATAALLAMSAACGAALTPAPRACALPLLAGAAALARSTGGIVTDERPPAKDAPAGVAA